MTILDMASIAAQYEQMFPQFEAAIAAEQAAAQAQEEAAEGEEEVDLIQLSRFFTMYNKKRTTLQRPLYVIQEGFEPPTHRLEICCSIQLSYWTDPAPRFMGKRMQR